MRFERKKYLEKLISSQGNGLVKIVTGVRRCGKSFLLFELFRDYLHQQNVRDDHIIALSLDQWEMRPLRTQDKLNRNMAVN